MTFDSGNGWTVNESIATRNVANVRAGTSRSFPISFTINEGAQSPITNIAEISADSGEDCDSTPSSTNGDTPGEQAGNIVDGSIGTGCDEGGDEDDHDPEIITFDEPIYDLALVKEYNGIDDLQAGGSVVFDIVVTNQGNIDSGSVTVTDYIPSELTLVAGNGWTRSGSQATQTITNIPANGGSVTLPISFTINADAEGSIVNLAEISADSGDDCDSRPDSDPTNGNEDGNGETDSTGMVNGDIGTGCDEDGDEDDHDPETIVLGSDLELIKKLKDGQSSNVSAGDDVTFTILVKNTGTTLQTNLRVEDHFPAGLVLNDAAWELDNSRTRVAVLKTPIASLAAGATSTPIDITFTVEADATGSLENAATVCQDGANCDTPEPPETCNDADERNNPDGCAPVTIGDPEASIAIDKTDANDADQDNEVADTQTVDRGDDAVFQITVTNDGNINLTNVVIADDEGPACVRTASQTTTLIR